MNMRITVLVILSSTFVVCNAVFNCTAGVNQYCSLSLWEGWSNCTSSCGGGTSRRFKQLCCNKSYKTIEKCAADCNITRKEYSETKVCGQTCINGVFRKDKCQCPNKFTGKCCETEMITVHRTTEGFTASPGKTMITRNECEQGCKFGECNNGKCICMVFFKETPVQNIWIQRGRGPRTPLWRYIYAEQWFLVAASVLGTILMMMLFCCICRVCCGYGNKVEPEETEQSVE